jgi:hypothetical protein
MIIHQIFLKLSDKKLEDFPVYLESIKKWKDICQKNDWEYMLHTEIDETIMTDEEKKVMKLGRERYYFYPIDFYKCIVLSKYKGMYIDLDVLPTDNFCKIKDDETIVGRHAGGRNKESVNNNVIRLKDELYDELKEYMVKTTYEKLSIKVYETWKIRFLLQCGPHMFRRFCKMKKITYHEDYDSYFVDYNTNCWDK